MKRYAIGTIVGGASLFLLGFLIYVILLPDPAFAKGPAAAAANRAEPNLPPIIVAELLYGFLLTRALVKSGAVTSVGNSAKSGALIGGVLGLSFVLIMLGTTEVVTLPGALYEGATWAVRWAVAAVVLSKVLGKMTD